MSLTFDQIRERLAARFPEDVGPVVAAKDPFVVVKGEKLLDIARWLHDAPEVSLDYLIDETAVDYPKESLIRVVYHLWSMSQKHGFKLKVECPRENPSVTSIESVWRGANWLEREVFDLFGVQFIGHPDLRRIMMPEDWVGHPLRKDYQAPESYHGISHARVRPSGSAGVPPATVSEASKAGVAAPGAGVPPAAKPEPSTGAPK